MSGNDQFVEVCRLLGIQLTQPESSTIRRLGERYLRNSFSNEWSARACRRFEQGIGSVKVPSIPHGGWHAEGLSQKVLPTPTGRQKPMVVPVEKGQAEELLEVRAIQLDLGSPVEFPVGIPSNPACWSRSLRLC